MKKIVYSFVFLLLITHSALTNAKAEIAIIIDDIGYQLRSGKSLIDSPANFTFAILPNTPYGIRLANYANEKGKDIILHLPMQGSKDYLSEPLTLNGNMDEIVFKASVLDLLNSVPHIIGVNNHMGSILTQDNKYMTWVMQSILQNNNKLFFIDSLTSEKSVAQSTAQSFGIPTLARDIFLDNVINEEQIQKSFDRLILKAIKNGKAIAIAHPHKATINVLMRNIAELDKHNVQLVPVSTMLPVTRQLTQQ